MKKAWTPGPWQVNGVRHSGDLALGKNTRLHFVGPDGDHVCAVFFDMKTAKGFADAHLIAAAPAMAEAIESFLSAYDDKGRLTAAQVVEEIAALRAALATGGKDD